MHWRSAVTSSAADATAATGDLSRQPHIGAITALERNACVPAALLSAGMDGRVRIWKAESTLHEVLLLEPFDVAVACATWASFKASVFAVRCCCAYHLAGCIRCVA